MLMLGSELDLGRLSKSSFHKWRIYSIKESLNMLFLLGCTTEGAKDKVNIFSCRLWNLNRVGNAFFLLKLLNIWCSQWILSYLSVILYTISSHWYPTVELAGLHPVICLWFFFADSQVASIPKPGIKLYFQKLPHANLQRDWLKISCYPWEIWGPLKKEKYTVFFCSPLESS